MEFRCPHCNEVLATEIEVAVGQHVICPYCERKFAYGVPVERGVPTVDASAREVNISQTNTRHVPPDLDIDLAAHLTNQGIRFWVVNNRLYFDFTGIDYDFVTDGMDDASDEGRMLEALDMFADFDAFDKWPTDAGIITRRDGDKLSKLKEGPYAIWIVRGGRWLCVDSNNRMSANAGKGGTNTLVALRESVCNEIMKFSWPQVFGVVECPYFDCDDDERMLWWGKVKYVGDASKNFGHYWDGLEDCREGLLFLTNRRVCFSGNEHKQEYKIKNIRTLWTNWYEKKGSLIIGSSVKKTEQYVADGIWKPALILSILWNELVRMRFLECSKNDLCSDVCKTICCHESIDDVSRVDVDGEVKYRIEIEWERSLI